MIRFRTIEPDTAAKAGKAQAAVPAGSPPEQAPPPEAETATEAKPKGLTRKAPLRAKKPEPARLFQE